MNELSVPISVHQSESKHTSCSEGGIHLFLNHIVSKGYHKCRRAISAPFY